MKYYGVHGRLPRAIPKEVVWKMSKGVLISATANGCILGWGCSQTHATELTENMRFGVFSPVAFEWVARVFWVILFFGGV